MAIWIRDAANGASRAMAIAANGFALRRSPPPNSSIICATEVMTPATAAATDAVRMSRL